MPKKQIPDSDSELIAVLKKIIETAELKNITRDIMLGHTTDCKLSPCERVAGALQDSPESSTRHDEQEKIDKMDNCPSRDDEHCLDEPFKISKRKCIESGYFDMLFVTTNATLGEIKSQYKVLLIRLHPDKHSSQDKEKYLETEQLFKEVCNAYREVNRTFTSLPIETAKGYYITWGSHDVSKSAKQSIADISTLMDLLDGRIRLGHK